MSADSFVHINRVTTQADWNVLDPETYEATCGGCGTPYEGRFGPDHSLASPCPKCGSAKCGAITSPAGATHLILWSD